LPKLVDRCREFDAIAIYGRFGGGHHRESVDTPANGLVRACYAVENSTIICEASSIDKQTVVCRISNLARPVAFGAGSVLQACTT